MTVTRTSGGVGAGRISGIGIGTSRIGAGGIGAGIDGDVGAGSGNCKGAGIYAGIHAIETINTRTSV